MKKFKEMLQSINKFGLALVLVATTLVITQSAFTEAKKVDTYRYDSTLPQQDWNTTLDQDADNYSIVDPSSIDCLDSDKICTYQLDNGVFVQHSKGTLQ